eukprot:TRINITY_DN13178_c0_g1_i1.p1 TRINITY_DN13178_c0_g1~~TRINITY_DN13178_c0_g1_i1.p1  ORF type:complete len:124 (+),score=25.36 TRINITY_DN13178_c0_g1_i1:214-585(+)
MALVRTVASVFYNEFEDGRPFWVDFLGFAVVHQDEGICVLQRDGVKFCLLRDQEYVAAPPPLYRIEVDDIQAVWADIQTRHPERRFEHPRFVEGPELREWGCWEFAVKDEQACLVFQQWTTQD